MSFIVKYRYLRALVVWAGIFGMFVPFGYLPWFFAVPTSFFSFCFVARLLQAAYQIEQKKQSNPHA